MRKIYRVEEYTHATKQGYDKAPSDVTNTHVANDSYEKIASQRHAEIMNKLNSLHSSEHSSANVPNAISETFLTEMRKNMAEAQKLKAELDIMLEAIDKTKSDIAALHINAVDNGSVARVSDELDAIVTDTEGATNTILNAAENIETNALQLVAALKGSQQGQASDIQDQISSIYEACNFQDLTGQRINKVIKLLRFIEERVHHMMDIWGRIDTFKEVMPAYSEKAIGDAALLNGPSLASDQDVVNQSDIDALFA